MNTPTLGGWLVVFFYLIAAASCWMTGRHLVSRSPALHEYQKWRAIAAMLVILAIFRMTDVQNALPESGRHLAASEGWYADRRVLQTALVAAAILLCAAAAFVLLVRARQAPVPTWFGLIVATLLVGFILVRAVSLHAVDGLLARRAFGLSLNSLLETSGIALVLLASEWRRRFWNAGGA